MTSLNLPSLYLKINKGFKNENKNENINNINNTIIINKDTKDFTTELKELLPEIIEKSQTPEIIKIFIVFKEEDIIKLISILVTDGDVSRIKFKVYSCCSKLPVYR
jgi:hypothetical protein